MIVMLTLEGRKTKVTINGKTVEHKTAFLNKLSFKDALLYLESENKKVK
ncbi:hypothetical protein [uncultured Winogradskyella sp.]|nr:hypothetical protein [uncultured Winogradskyella sp.]